MLAMLLASGIFAWFAKDIRVDFSFDSFNPKGDTEYKFYQKYRKVFPHSDNAVQIALSNPAGSIWEPSFLLRVDSLMAAFDHSLLPAEEQAWREAMTASHQ